MSERPRAIIRKVPVKQGSAHMRTIKVTGVPEDEPIVERITRGRSDLCRLSALEHAYVLAPHLRHFARRLCGDSDDGSLVRRLSRGGHARQLLRVL